jgi:hypothetical protein
MPQSAEPVLGPIAADRAVGLPRRAASLNGGAGVFDARADGFPPDSLLCSSEVGFDHRPRSRGDSQGARRGPSRAPAIHPKARERGAKVPLRPSNRCRRVEPPGMVLLCSPEVPSDSQRRGNPP